MLNRSSRILGVVFGSVSAGPLRSFLPRARRGQTRVESAVALGALILAGMGAWMLYGDSIVETARAMVDYFSSSDSG